MVDVLILLAGLALLIVGGELLVRGSVAIAEQLGLSPLIIGIVLVGFGTSVPELVTCIEAALRGFPGIAVGNIVGSNIANILLIVGVSATIAPMMVASNALRRDGSVVLAVAVAFAALTPFFSLDRAVGAVLVLLLVTYIYYAYQQEKLAASAGHTAAFEKAEAYEEAHRVGANPGQTGESQSSGLSGIWPYLMALGGLVIIIFGGKLLVTGAVELARAWGVSETVIGLTIVAVGTSAPELVTSTIAALRNHSDVAIGNIMGSNIYNILGIGGATALVAPVTVPPEVINYDNLVMVAASVALLVFAATGSRISRLEGAVLLSGYALYIWSLWPK